jgi:hypothetical protein
VGAAFWSVDGTDTEATVVAILAGLRHGTKTNADACRAMADRARQTASSTGPGT